MTFIHGELTNKILKTVNDQKRLTLDNSDELQNYIKYLRYSQQITKQTSKQIEQIINLQKLMVGIVDPSPLPQGYSSHSLDPGKVCLV